MDCFFVRTSPLLVGILAERSAYFKGVNHKVACRTSRIPERRILNEEPRKLSRSTFLILPVASRDMEQKPFVIPL